jgi:hypothetical protein
MGLPGAIRDAASSRVKGIDLSVSSLPLCDYDPCLSCTPRNVVNESQGCVITTVSLAY